MEVKIKLFEGGVIPTKGTDLAAQVSKKGWEFYLSVPSDGSKPIPLATISELSEFTTEVSEVADCFNKVSKCLYNFSWSIKKSNRAFRIITNWIKTDRYRYRTGIQPKWSNRTRKKQRLTRLQRRHKRQRK